MYQVLLLVILPLVVNGDLIQEICSLPLIKASSDITTTSTNVDGTTCTLRITALSNTTRIALNVTVLKSTKHDNLTVGNGHNSSNDDSIFIDLINGLPRRFSMVSSGFQLWINYSTPVDEMTTKGLSLKLQSHRENDVTLHCLQTCQCLWMNRELEIQCLLGWSSNVISKLPQSLNHLTLSGGLMTTLANKTFSRLQQMETLALLGNSLELIQNDTFVGLENLQVLNLSSNSLRDLEYNAFKGLPQLYHLDLRVNNLTILVPERFENLQALKKLYLHNNQIHDLPDNMCSYLPKYNALSMRLDGNRLTRIPPGVFSACEMIITLKMSRNQITHLRNGSFHGLTQTWSLELSKNDIKIIDKGAFADMSRLVILRLKENNIVTLRYHAFLGLFNLRMLDLRYNPWKNIESEAFWGMPNLTYLFLERFEKDRKYGKLTLTSLDGLDSLQDMLVDDYRLCCFKSDDLCSPQTAQPLFHTCKRLMPNTILQTLLWLLGVSAMAGNLYVIILRCQEKHVRNPTQSILILNLALSDLIMGFYMLTIAAADVHFGNEFFISAEVWKSSALCMFAGFLSLFSSEASVFFVVLISIDRLLCVALPFGKKRMTAYLAKLSCTLVWILVGIIGIIAVILQVAETDAYDLATVCVGIPLVSTKKVKMREVTDNVHHAGDSIHKKVMETTDTASTWQFAIAIYLGVNFLAFVIVLACYVTIAAIVAAKLPTKQLQRKSGRRREMKMAGRMALIVFTDFWCWMPIIFLGILIQSGTVKAVPIDVYAWIVALVLPLNAALNPYIYTLSTELSKKKRKRKDKKEAVSLRRVTANSQTMNNQTKTSCYTNL